MGQYYKLAVLNDKRRNAKNSEKIACALSSYDYENGAKLMEFSYIGNWFVSVFEELINQEHGKYAGLPVVCCGDYADEECYKLNANSIRYMGGDSEDVRCDSGEKPTLYTLAQYYIQSHKDTKPTKRNHYRYIINLDKKVFIDTDNIKRDTDGYRIHPLTLLISEGNGRGGGDYNGKNMRYVGTWARNRVVVSDNRPDESFKERVYNFKEG